MHAIFAAALLAGTAGAASAGKALVARQDEQLLPCTDVVGVNCCGDGTSYCPLTRTCYLGTNGEYGCCPIGRVCSGPGNEVTDVVVTGGEPTETPVPDPTYEPPTETPDYPTETPDYPTETPDYPTETPPYPTESPPYPTETPPYETETPTYGTAVPTLNGTTTYTPPQITDNAAGRAAAGVVQVLGVAVAALAVL